MKPMLTLCAVCGVLFAVPAFFILLFFVPHLALPLAIAAGLLFAALLLPILVVHERVVDKKYAKFEASLESPCFCRITGNFLLDQRVRSANIYFCEGQIILASLTEKPLTVEKLPLEMIERFELDDIHMNIYTNDGREFLITTAEAPRAAQALKDQGWT